MIYNQYRSSLGRIFHLLCVYKDIEIIEGYFIPDYVYMLMSIPSKIGVLNFMGYLKGKSSLLMFDYMQTLNISMVIGNFGRKATMCQQ